jgi:hypothetical protein
MSLEYFFKNIIHQKFYSNYDISFMEYFLELTAHDGEFVVHHEKLIEYGIVTSKNSARVKDRLDDLGLVEDIDYSELEDILQLRPQGGTSTKKVYMLTPEAFKTCLMRARKYPNQKVDPVIYSKYYLLLEKTYGLYRDYQNILLVKQLEQKDEQLEQKDHQLEQKDHQLETQAQQIEEQRRYTLDLQEGLLGNIPELEKTQIVYIATSHNYAKRNLFKVGGIENEKHIVSRLCTYNTGRAAGDDYFYTNIYKVHDYREVESRLKKLIGSFRDRKDKEMYRMCYNNLTYILEYIIDHFNEEVDEVNKSLETFILNLNNRCIISVPVVPLILAQIYQHEKPYVVLSADTPNTLLIKMTEYIENVDKNVKVVKAKDVFDTIGLKKDRKINYPILEEIINKMLPDVRMVKF